MSTTTHALPLHQPNPMEPPPVLAELREHAPVVRVTTPDGRTAWLTTTYDAANAVLSDRRFGMAPAGIDATSNDTLFQDGDNHTRLRRLVTKAFTPRSITAMRPRMTALAEELVDAMTAGDRYGELVEGLAAPLAISVICELLGVTIDEREHFRRLADTVNSIDIHAAGSEEEAALAAQAWTDLAVYAAGLVSAMREQPGDDLISALIAVNDSDDGRLSDGELIGMATSLVAAGYLTARNSISAAAIRFIGERRLAALVAEPERFDATIDELLRHLGGIVGNPMPRWAHEDVEVVGVAIAKDEMVLVHLEAANRDPAHFDAPDEFRTDRESSPHLSFGRGPHHCLGAALARIEIGVALSTLATKLPGIRLAVPAEEVPWSAVSTDRGPDAVHVTW